MRASVCELPSSANARSLGFGLSLPVQRAPVKRAKPILTHAQIQALYAIRWTVTQEEAATLFGTSQSIVGRIWNRQAWLSVTEDMGPAREGWHERRGVFAAPEYVPLQGADA